MIGAKADIAFAIGILPKFVSKPSRKHLIAERVIRYLNFQRIIIYNTLEDNLVKIWSCMVTVMHLGDAKMMVRQ
jgi:hypothetical protein